MTTDPRDPSTAGLRPDVGAQPGRRPSATIDLQATEIGDDIRTDAGSAARGEPGENSAETGTSPEANASPDLTRTTAATGKSARRAGNLSNLVNNLVAGIAGAALAIFGADYLASTLGLTIPTYSAGQIDQLSRRMGAIEQDNKERGPGVEASLLKEQIEALKGRLEQSSSAPALIEALQAQQKQLTDRAAKLEQMLSAQAPSPDAANRIGKLEDQFKMLAQSGSGGSGGQPGQMAALVAKIDQIGSNLDLHLAEMRKSLQGDLQKQSSHFEDRLGEIDKGLSVETLKASTKVQGEELVSIKAQAQKLAQDIAAVGAGTKQMHEDLAALQQTTGDLKSQLQLASGSFAKTDQLSSVSATATKLQADIAAIAARDQNRDAGAKRILLSLQLANLKRVVERGGGYAKELADVKRIAPKELDLSALESSADKGLPTASQLATTFKDMTWSLVNADSKPSDDGSLIGQLWQGARSVVQVRRTGETSGDSTDAIVARTESRLQAGDLEGAQHEAGQLKGDARKLIEPWLGQVSARLSLDHSIAAVETGLVSLMGPQGTSSAN